MMKRLPVYLSGRAIRKPLFRSFGKDIALKQSLLKHTLVVALFVCLTGGIFATLPSAGVAHAAPAKTASCQDSLYAVTFARGPQWVPQNIASTTTDRCNKLDLIYQADGNLVMYCNGNAIWATNTGPEGWGTNTTQFQNDGNFVVYNRNIFGQDVAVWASNTNNRGAELLVLQRDGNLVIYQSGYSNPLWASGTGGRC